jgi:hypothetical protein
VDDPNELSKVTPALQVWRVVHCVFDVAVHVALRTVAPVHVVQNPHSASSVAVPGVRKYCPRPVQLRCGVHTVSIVPAQPLEAKPDRQTPHWLHTPVVWLRTRPRAHPSKHTPAATVGRLAACGTSTQNTRFDGIAGSMMSTVNCEMPVGAARAPPNVAVQSPTRSHVALNDSPLMAVPPFDTAHDESLSMAANVRSRIRMDVNAAVSVKFPDRVTSTEIADEFVATGDPYCAINDVNVA